MASNFFGLKPEHKDKIHEEVFTICYYSKGGFTHTEVYGMPVYLKRWYLKKLADVKKEEKKQHEQASKGKGPTQGVQRPRIPRR